MIKKKTKTSPLNWTVCYWFRILTISSGRLWADDNTLHIIYISTDHPRIKKKEHNIIVIQMKSFTLCNFPQQSQQKQECNLKNMTTKWEKKNRKQNENAFIHLHNWRSTTNKKIQLIAFTNIRTRYVISHTKRRNEHLNGFPFISMEIFDWHISHHSPFSIIWIYVNYKIIDHHIYVKNAILCLTERNLFFFPSLCRIFLYNNLLFLITKELNSQQNNLC